MSTNSGGGSDKLTSEEQGAVDSILNLPDNAVPKAESGQLEVSGTDVDPTSEEFNFSQSINLPPASINLGENITVSDFGELVSLRNNATDINQVANGGNEIESEGILSPLVPTSPPSEQLASQPITTDLGPVFDENNPLTFELNPSLFTSSVPSTEFLILENIVELAQVPDGGQVRVENFIGTDDTGHRIFNHVFDVSVGVFSFKPPAPQVFRVGVTYFVKSTPIGPGNYQVKGLQVGPDFFDNADIRGYPIQRSQLITRETVGSSKHRYLCLNDEHPSTTAENGGLKFIYNKTVTADTMTAGTFTPGEDGVSNPTMDTDTAAPFAQNDIVLVENTNFNNGLYEVHDSSANLLTLRGVGTDATVEDFTRDNFITGTGDATVTKVEVAIIRFNTSGDLEAGKGSETPILFSPVGGGEIPITIFDANDALFPSSNPAAADSRNGHPILAYDDTTAENVIFTDSLRGGYLGGDIIVDIDWIAATATTGGVTWGVEFERNAPGGTDIDSDSFDTQQIGTSTTNATSGIITRTTITLTQAEADDIEALDGYRLRVQRVVGDVGDDMTGDAQVFKVRVR